MSQGSCVYSVGEIEMTVVLANGRMPRCSPRSLARTPSVASAHFSSLSRRPFALEYFGKLQNRFAVESEDTSSLAVSRSSCCRQNLSSRRPFSSIASFFSIDLHSSLLVCANLGDFELGARRNLVDLQFPYSPAVSIRWNRPIASKCRGSGTWNVRSDVEKALSDEERDRIVEHELLARLAESEKGTRKVAPENSGTRDADGHLRGELAREEQKRAAFEQWAVRKVKEDGPSALEAIEEMRRTFAPGSSIPAEMLGSGGASFDGDKEYKHRVLFSSAKAERMRLGGRRHAVVEQGSSGPRVVVRSSTRIESRSPKSTTISRGQSGKSLASGGAEQLSTEGMEQTTAASMSGVLSENEIAQPLLVKRSTKFPVNWDGRTGTVVLVDKPQGWTSFAVCAKLRYLLKIQKVGHAGTLDPMATGLLIVLLGKATKLADSYQAMTKVYSGTIRLGELTPSLDSFTEVSDFLPWEHITDSQLDRAKQDFMGDIIQTPPMYSAIKVKGERLYMKARRGEKIDVPPRLVSVTDFQLERSSENRQDIHFKVTCSKGTYVRSLCSDLAHAVGSCGHLTALRRERIGKYSVRDAWPIINLVEEYSQLNNAVKG